jgi:putative SOS response-associated peptidase YedK
MCNLYSMTRAREAVLRLFRVSDNRAAAIMPLPAIFPGHMAPVVRQTADGDREVVNLSWGFVLLQDGKAPRRVTNFRDDKARSSSFWRPSFEQRRCLVPASSFCEPKDTKPASWHWFALRGEEPRPLFAFAGIWRNYRGPIKKDGLTVDLDVFSFLTTTPNALVSTINHERMPVILSTDDEFEQWMTGTPAEAFTLTREYPPDAMRIVQEGAEKADQLIES